MPKTIKMSGIIGEEELLPVCECGCGEPVTKIGNRFIKGHTGGCKKGFKYSSDVIEANRLRGIERWSKQDERDAASKRTTKYFSIQTNRDASSESKLKEKPPLPDEVLNKIPSNKNCALYLGGIAEHLLIKMFKEVKVMSFGNHGFDFICNQNFKIDAKSSATGHNGYWRFNINKNSIADYFYFDSV